MSMLWLSLFAMVLLILLVSIGVFYFTEVGLIFITVLTLGLCLAIYCNPDMYHWFLYEKDKQSLASAQMILKNPQSLKNLTQKLEKRLVLHPEDAKAWFLLGRIQAAQEHWNKAHDALLQAYRLKPQDISTALFYVETIWHVEGRLNDLARTILLKALAQDSQQPDALMLLATEARQRNCPKEALVYLRKLRRVLASQADIRQNIDEAIIQANQADDSQCVHVSSV